MCYNINVVRNTAKNMREWRNWQTRTFEVRVVHHTGSSPVSRTSRQGATLHSFIAAGCPRCQTSRLTIIAVLRDTPRPLFAALPCGESRMGTPSVTLRVPPPSGREALECPFRCPGGRRTDAARICFKTAFVSGRDVRVQGRPLPGTLRVPPPSERDDYFRKELL